MFWGKKKEAERLAELRKSFGVLVPEPVVTLASLGADGVIADAIVEFVFLLIEDESSEQFCISASNAIKIATQHKAIVVANAGGLLQLAAGPRRDDADCTQYRVSLADELTRSLG